MCDGLAFLVGEILDEHERPLDTIRPAGENAVVVAGTAHIRDVSRAHQALLLLHLVGLTTLDVRPADSVACVAGWTVRRLGTHGTANASACLIGADRAVLAFVRLTNIVAFLPDFRRAAASYQRQDYGQISERPKPIAVRLPHRPSIDAPCIR